MRLEDASSEAKLAEQCESHREQQRSEQRDQGNEQQGGTGLDRGPVDAEGGPASGPRSRVLIPRNSGGPGRLEPARNGNGGRCRRPLHACRSHRR